MNTAEWREWVVQAQRTHSSASTPVDISEAGRELLPLAAEALGWPTEGRFAAYLWQRLSSSRYPCDQAAALYRACGYIPFCGYPLVRSGKVGVLTRDDVERELATNPYCHLTDELG